MTPDQSLFAVRELLLPSGKGDDKRTNAAVYRLRGSVIGRVGITRCFSFLSPSSRRCTDRYPRWLVVVSQSVSGERGILL
jgi:hypothetical protein